MVFTCSFPFRSFLSISYPVPATYTSLSVLTLCSVLFLVVLSVILRSASFVSLLLFSYCLCICCLLAFYLGVLYALYGWVSASHSYLCLCTSLVLFVVPSVFAYVWSLLVWVLYVSFLCYLSSSVFNDPFCGVLFSSVLWGGFPRISTALVYVSMPLFFHTLSVVVYSYSCHPIACYRARWPFFPGVIARGPPPYGRAHTPPVHATMRAVALSPGVIEKGAVAMWSCPCTSCACDHLSDSFSRGHRKRGRCSVVMPMHHQCM